MKKALKTIAAVAVFAILFTSCKKDWTCTCTIKDSGVVISTSSVTFHASRKVAKSSCDGLVVTSGTLVETCEVK